ncbi:MAG: hybrid sensor histidine kinase/response regulator [Bdellovibrionota bacterium]
MLESSLHILMVDDITRYQKLYEYAIKEAMQAEVSFATNGIEALEKLKEAEQYNLLILDLNMPKLDGEETLKRIRKNANLDHLPIIILTGNSDEETQRRLLELGADDFIEKGAPPELFVARLKALTRYKMTIDRLTSLAMDMDLFAAGVLHDIRNLEKNIISICHSVRTLLHNDPVKNKNAILDEIDALKQQSVRIGSYANDIIQIVRDTRVEPKLVKQNLISIIHWTKSILIDFNANLKASIWEEPDEYMPVLGDEKLLKLVFFNLIQNSLRYTRDGENPHIVISQQRTTDSLGESSSRILTKVRDYGYGIPHSELREVFKPFVKGASRKKDSIDNISQEPLGFGLGLALVTKVVSAMNGKIWAELPTQGPGTIICLELPSASDLQEDSYD